MQIANSMQLFSADHMEEITILNTDALTLTLYSVDDGDDLDGWTCSGGCGNGQFWRDVSNVLHEHHRRRRIRRLRICPDLRILRQRHSDQSRGRHLIPFKIHEV